MHELFIINSNVENLFSPLASGVCEQVHLRSQHASEEERNKTNNINCQVVTYESDEFFSFI